MSVASALRDLLLSDEDEPKQFFLHEDPQAGLLGIDSESLNKHARQQLNLLPDCRSFDSNIFTQEELEERSYASSIVHDVELCGPRNIQGEAAQNFAPSYVTCCCSSGAVNIFRLKDLIEMQEQELAEPFRAEPLLRLSAHSGPAHSLKSLSLPDSTPSLLLSCGADGRILGWRWSELEQLMRGAGGGRGNGGVDMDAAEGSVTGSAHWKESSHGKRPFMSSLQQAEGASAPALEMQGSPTRSSKGMLCPPALLTDLALPTDGASVWAASADGHAYCWDLATQSCVNSLTVSQGLSNAASQSSSSSNSVLRILASPSSAPAQLGSLLVTGSADGFVRLWDSRSCSPMAWLDPFRAVSSTQKGRKAPGGKPPARAPSASAATAPPPSAPPPLPPHPPPSPPAERREGGPWVSSLALDDKGEWLLAGSSGRTVTVFNLRTLSAALRIRMGSITPLALHMAGDEITIAGSQPTITRWSLGGQLISKQESRAPAILSSHCHRASGLSVFAGFGGVVDIISDYESHLCSFKCK